MATSSQNTKPHHDQLEGELQQLLLSLPKDKWFGFPMHLYQGFWCVDPIFEGIIASQTHFNAQDTDIMLASLPKAGTTWLKSLIFTIINRKNISHISQHPLHSKNPHELIPHLEFKVYKESQQDVDEIPSPRLFATHIPYLALPESIKSSKCRIVYVCRNPLDNFVSACHFWLEFDRNKGIKLDTEMIEEHLDKYCKGVLPYGPYEDHLLGYWNESMKNPQKVLFLEFEGLKKDTKAHIIRLAEFLNCPFSEEEAKGDAIDEIIKLCSLKNLKEMEVNKSGRVNQWYENKAYFRKGEVGDWTNYLTLPMAKRVNEIQEKLENAGFSFANYKMNL
ncbi:cytosolic sulfotransferase 5 [Spinacia oleracea]|uniref:Sulfotransferase n=1 Tax=Spinacia oleracea TaxID=3562 RepID=A0A9R0JKA9_SPIOL|nr:cytosolic sulfotransferase 5-like [Spinacia oleracea]